MLAAGLSILETSANPFAIAMGPEDTATRRLNLAQVFNPVGANIGVRLGALVITPNIIPQLRWSGERHPESRARRRRRDLRIG